MVLYSFRGVALSDPSITKRSFEDYTRWGVVSLVGALAGIVTTSVLLLRRWRKKKKRKTWLKGCFLLFFFLFSSLFFSCISDSDRPYIIHTYTHTQHMHISSFFFYARFQPVFLSPFPLHQRKKKNVITIYAKTQNSSSPPILLFYAIYYLTFNKIKSFPRFYSIYFLLYIFNEDWRLQLLVKIR